MKFMNFTVLSAICVLAASLQGSIYTRSQHYKTPQTWSCIAKWKNIPLANTQDLCLLFQGDILKYVDGMYSFNVTPSPLGFYMLVVSPEHIHYSAAKGVSNIANLFMDHVINYRLYWIHALDQNDRSLTPEMRCTRVFFTPQDNADCTIPPHTLIIPVSPDFIKIDDNPSAKFIKTKNGTSSILTMPDITFLPTVGNKTLQSALNRSRLALLNLRAIHAPQAHDTLVSGPTKITRVR